MNFKQLCFTSAVLSFSCAGNAFAASVLIQNDFDGVADDIGPVFQQLTNGTNSTNSGSFNPATGLVDNTSGTTNSTGFDNVSLVTLSPSALEITATFVISSVVNVANIQSNGLFLGFVTGADATATNSDALFNNDAGSFGLNLLQGGVNSRIIQDGVNSGPNTVVQTITGPTDASIADGFTFTLTLRDDNTYDASTTGLSTDVAIVNGTLSGGNPLFNDFLVGGIGLNGSIQGADVDLTIDSVVLTETVPEPSTGLLSIFGLGALLIRRRR